MELPEGCIASILYHTTPLDVARLSAVSKIFRSAADSNTIWDHFLPSNYHSIVSQCPSLSNAPSKKTLCLALSNRPVIIDQGKKSFQLEKKTGKKCYMLSARTLTITRARDDDERYLHWINLPESRFEVAMHIASGWFIIQGKINTSALSSNTEYTTFLVFKLTDTCEALYSPMELMVGFRGTARFLGKVYLDPRLKGRLLDNRFKRPKCPNVRSDGLFEIEMNEFFNSGLDDYELQISIMQLDKNWWSSFYLEGIEFRPKISNP